MNTKKERAIIFRAVLEATQKTDIGTRGEIAREAAIISDRRGVNVTTAPYRESIFLEALDKKQKEKRLQ